MQIGIPRDPEDSRILATYARISRDEVRKTIEIAHGACYADAKGKPLGSKWSRVGVWACRCEMSGRK